MTPLLVVALLLHPVVDEATDLRVASTSEAPVQWVLDGQTVATTHAGEAARFPFGPGEGDLWAIGPDDEDWTAMARPIPTGAGIQEVHAWTAHHQASAPEGKPWLLPLLVTATLTGLAARLRFAKQP